MSILAHFIIQSFKLIIVAAIELEGRQTVVVMSVLVHSSSHFSYILWSLLKVIENTLELFYLFITMSFPASVSLYEEFARFKFVIRICH